MVLRPNDIRIVCAWSEDELLLGIQLEFSQIKGSSYGLELKRLAGRVHLSGSIPLEITDFECPHSKC